MKKTLSILLVMIMMFSVSGITVFADAEMYADIGNGVYSSGESAIGVVCLGVYNGTYTVNHIEPGLTEITVEPDAGLSLLSHVETTYFFWEPENVTYQLTAEISGDVVVYRMELVPNGEIELSAYTSYEPSMSRSSFERFIEYCENGSGFRSEVFAMAVVEVTYGEAPEPQPLPDLYAVRVESNPAGIATFSGYGTGFQDGDAYNVAILSADPNYEFTGWVGSPSGNIAGADVSLVANFEQVVFEDEETPEALEVRYEVSAVSQPAGVGTFTGEGLFRSGDSFNVQVATIMEGYEFLRWETVNTGVVDGADVEVVAVFGEITEEPVQEPTEEPVDEPVEDVLDEEIPEDVDTLPETAGVPFVIFGAVGAVISGGGLYIRKKK